MISNRLLVFILAAVLLLGTLVFPIDTVSAQSCLGKTFAGCLAEQQRLKLEQEEAQKKFEKTRRDAQNLQNLVVGLENDIDYTQSKIRNAEDQIRVAEEIISSLGNNINVRQQRLSAAYVSLYETSRTTQTSQLILQNSLNDALSEAQYIQSIQSQLQKDLTDLRSSKAESERQKADLESQRTGLVSNKNELAVKKSQKNKLLTQTQGEQARYEELLKKLEKQRETVSKELYELRRKQTGRYSDGGTGGYPYSRQCGIVDEWLYYSCQCTSYAAWKFASYYGIPFDNTRPGEGSAYNWPNLARDQGYKTSSTPRANTLVSWSKSQSSPYYGHVAWVLATYPNGTIDVAEYNFRVREGYGERYGIRPTDPYFGTPTYIYP